MNKIPVKNDGLNLNASRGFIGFFLLTGCEGSGKSHYLGGLLVGTLAQDDQPEFDTLGTEIAPNTAGHAVLLYDTEQSDAQLYRNLELIARRAQCKSHASSCFRENGLTG